MVYEIKKYTKNTETKMNLTSAVKNRTSRYSPRLYAENLKIFPAVVETEDPCKIINKNLFQLEKNLAYFQFAIKEIKDITR